MSQQAGIAAYQATRPVTFEQAEERVVAALAGAPVSEHAYRTRFHEEFSKHYRGLIDENYRRISDSATIYAAKQTGQMYDLSALFTVYTPYFSDSDAERIQHYTDRLSKDELVAVHAAVARVKETPPYTVRPDLPVRAILDQAMRTRLSRDEIKSHRETVALNQSNISTYMHYRMGGLAAMQIQGYIGQDRITPYRALDRAQQARMDIDGARRIRDEHRHPTRAPTPEDRVRRPREWAEFVRSVVFRLNQMQHHAFTWSDTLSYLTAVEIAAVGEYASNSKYRSSEAWFNFCTRLERAADAMRAERHAAEQSGLLQSPRRDPATGQLLAPWGHRDAGAMRYLSTWLSPSVVLRQPHTHFRSHAQLAVASFLALPTEGSSSHKRKVQGGTADPQKKQREDDEEGKEQDEME